MDINRFGILVEAECVDCTAEVVVNGIPLGLAGLGPEARFECPVHEYLVEGVNEIGLVIQPGNSPAEWRSPTAKSKPAWHAQPKETPLSRSFAGGAAPPTPPTNGSAPVEPPDDKDPDWGLEHVVLWDVEGLAALPSMRAQARLARYPVGAVAGKGQGETILEVSWNAHREFRTLRQEEQPFPKWVPGSGDLGPMFGPLHWQKFSPLTLDPETIASLKKFALQIRDEIETGQPEGILAISREKYTEVARAYGLDKNERAGVFRNVLKDHSSDEDGLFQTPETDEWSFRLCADGRLVECIAKDWTPLIEGIRVPGKGRFLYPMLVGGSGDH